MGISVGERECTQVTQRRGRGQLPQEWEDVVCGVKEGAEAGVSINTPDHMNEHKGNCQNTAMHE